LPILSWLALRVGEIILPAFAFFWIILVDCCVANCNPLTVRLPELVSPCVVLRKVIPVLPAVVGLPMILDPAIVEMHVSVSVTPVQEFFLF